MLDIKLLRDDLDLVKQRIATRGTKIGWERFSALDRERREMLATLERLKEKKNQLSGEIGKLKKSGADASAPMREIGELSKAIGEREGPLAQAERRFEEFMLLIPNLPHDSVPAGSGAADNREVRRWGEIPRFDFTPKNHWDIGEELEILDFARAAKIAGARFALYRGQGALLERALIQFMLDLHTRERGYQEIIPPFLVNRDAMTGTGQLPKFEQELFRTADPDWFLIPTAEVPLTNIHREEILEREGLPIRYVAYTPCFRREAGSYGQDVRGLIRLHQFNKVELVKLSEPQNSYEELEKMVADAEEVLKRLKLPYRVVELCAGDLGFASAKTYDLEVWLPGQGTYREISSCSNCEEFQARRAQIRYRPEKKGRTVYVHTLNGSALAVGRTLVAVLENYQQKDGTVVVPEVLRPYMGGLDRIG
ncbi:MAG: serine--tRNA ligase [Deltaproteobacteria bacterium]|nr:serine--tRNA ligase [Deltaproteobacteria bacterium]